MTEDNNNADNMSISQKIGHLLDYNQAVVVTSRQQAENWKKIAIAYVEMAQAATSIAEDCALFARISVDRTGDVIAAEWDLKEAEEPEEDEAGEMGEENE